jgi:hypothetical protein
MGRQIVVVHREMERSDPKQKKTATKKRKKGGIASIWW